MHCICTSDDPLDDLAGKQQTVEAVEIPDSRYEGRRWTHPGHVIDAVVARRLDHAEPRLIHLRVRAADMRSVRKLGVTESGALNDVLGDAFLRGGAGYMLQELAEQLIVGVGIYPRKLTPGVPTAGAVTPISMSSAG